MQNLESPRTDDAGLEPLLSVGPAPRVTLAHLNAMVAASSIQYLNPTPTLTICVMTLPNGFTVTGESACASPENFSAKIGQDLSKAAAFNKLWPLEGYLLRQRLHDTPTNFKDRVRAEKHELDERLGKLEAFIDTELFATMPDAEQARMRRQASVMREYSTVLHERIGAFEAP